MPSQLCCVPHRRFYSSEAVNVRPPGHRSDGARHLFDISSADDSEHTPTAAAATSNDADVASNRPKQRRLVKTSTSSGLKNPVEKKSSSKTLASRLKRNLSRDSFNFGPSSRRSTPILPFLGSGTKASSSKAGDAIGLDPLDSTSVGGEDYDNDAQIISDSQAGLVTASTTPKDSQRTNLAAYHPTTISEVADDYTGLTADGTPALPAISHPMSAIAWQDGSPDTKKTFSDTTADITSSVNANGSGHCFEITSHPMTRAPRLPSLDETDPSFDFNFLDGGEVKHHEAISKDEAPVNAEDEAQSHPDTPALDGNVGDGSAGHGKDALTSMSDQYQNIVEDMMASYLASGSNPGSHLGLSPATNGPVEELDASTKSGNARTTNEDRALLSPREPSSEASVHLYDMRISQHLRSMTSLSSSSSSNPTMTSTHGRNVSKSSLKSVNARRYDWPSGFKSNKVPSSWGKVLERNTKSSSYSTLASSLTNVREIGSPKNPTSEGTAIDGAQELGASSESNLARELSSDQVFINEDGASSLKQSLSTSSQIEPSLEQAHDTASSSRPVKKKKAKLGRKKVSKTLRVLAHHNQRKKVIAFDGPIEEQVDFDAPKRPSRDSIGGNYDETAMVWQKALNAHEEQRVRRKSSVSPSSFRTAASQLLRGKTFVEPEKWPDSSATVEEHRNSLNFKPLETDHSFDRLTVPGRASISQETPLMLTPENSAKEGENTLYGRRKSASQQHLKTPTVDAPRRSSSVDYISASQAASTPVPEIKVTDAQSSKSHKTASTKRSVTSRRSDLGLAAWGRYPSHTRVERTLSAGTSDAVQPRDFATPESPTQDSDSPSDPKIGGHKTKHDFAKARAKARRQILFRDWSARVKPYLVGFRKGETGHRSSIAVEGELEYPELELGALHNEVEPKKTTAPNTKLNAESVKGGSARHKRSSSLQVNQYSNFEEYPKLDSSVRSTKSERKRLSGADSSTSSFNPSSKKQPQHQLSAPNWDMDELSPSPTLRHARTEEVSPLDGAYKQGERARGSGSSSAPLLPASGTAHSRMGSAGSQSRATSLSPRRLSRRASTGVVNENQGLHFPVPTKALSLEQMKSSTHSLWRFLDDADQLEVEKAMRIADGSWEY
ncbi:MAG: hypothetical protein M1831_006640 [Alyxoria varia]|nr:MAG: hypothetical protein M1831_006640 [Alyxoria varia]